MAFPKSIVHPTVSVALGVWSCLCLHHHLTLDCVASFVVCLLDCFWCSFWKRRLLNLSVICFTVKWRGMTYVDIGPCGTAVAECNQRPHIVAWPEPVCHGRRLWTNVSYCRSMNVELVASYLSPRSLFGVGCTRRREHIYRRRRVWWLVSSNLRARPWFDAEIRSRGFW